MVTAREAWDQNPMLAYAYGDFQAFAENLRMSRAHWTTSPSETVRLEDERNHQLVAEANARLDIATRPFSAIAGRRVYSVRDRGRLTLWLYGPIEHAYEPLIDALECNQDAAGIILRIDSSGGQAEPAFQLAGAIGSHRAKSIAIVDRSCWSAAVIPAVLCDLVYVRRSATMMIHKSHRWSVGNTDVLVAAALSCRQIDNRFMRMLLSHRRRADHKAFERYYNEERFLSSFEAKRCGLVDRVIPDIANNEHAELVQAAVTPRTHRGHNQ